MDAYFLLKLLTVTIAYGLTLFTHSYQRMLTVICPTYFFFCSLSGQVDIFLEIGRVSNLVFGNALKTAGDVIFSMVIASIFIYLCAVGGTYVFGIRLGLLAVGSYIGLASDECVRAIGMFLRWQSGKWRTMGLVQKGK